jgi:hypothetical protein
MRLPSNRLAPFGAVLMPLALVPALWLTGHRRPPSAPRAAAALPIRPLPTSELPAERLSDRVEQVVLAQKKRIMGRKKSLLYVSRVASEIGPLVARALDQPAVQADLRALADETGLTLPAYKEYFRRKQEADLLLESGGDPNARSVANAIGAAQWLASTGRGQGLRVDLAASRRLTAKIATLQADLEALQAQPPEFTRPAPPGWKETGRPGDGATGRRGIESPGRHGDTEKGTEGTNPLPSSSSSGPLTHPEHPPVTAETENAAAAAGPGAPAASPPAAPPAPAGASETQGASETSTPPSTTPTNVPGPDAPPVPPAPSPFAAPPSPSTSVAPPARRPVAPSPQWPRVRWIGYRKWQQSQLIAKRRQVDERYDPAKAIAAQTRYLVRLTRRCRPITAARGASQTRWAATWGTGGGSSPRRSARSAERWPAAAAP